MNFLFSDIFERNKKVSSHNKQAIQSYDGVMVRVIVSSAVDLRGEYRVFDRHGVKPKIVKVISTHSVNNKDKGIMCPME